MEQLDPSVSILHLYNTFSKKEENFAPIDPPHVTLYTCGPTVYGRPHIGNYSSFLMADLLRRWLEVKGYKVTHVKNITDVGHLVADSDHGEDKVEKQAREERVAVSGQRSAGSAVSDEDVLAIARRYEEQYLEDEKALNMREPEARPRATETIPEMLAMIKELLANGHAYETDDGIYFDVSSFKDEKGNRLYGKLSGNVLEDLEAGARVAVKEAKKHPADFALWKKAVGENARHLLRWHFQTGERVQSVGDDPSAGFPGWHIECSAMSRKHLGPRIDIHTGGEDNIFPHHESEIAQSESCGPAPFSRYWVHKRRIDMGEAKMSKSLGNILTVPDIEKMGFSPLDLRYYLLSVHYRTNLKFSKKGLEDAKKARRRIVEWIGVVEATKPVVHAHSHGMKESIENFEKAIDEDLNTPAALADIFAVMNFFYRDPKVTEEELHRYKSFIELIRQTFGCFEPEAKNEVPAEVQKLLEERAAARARKDFAASDRLRGEIERRGYELKDTKDGQKLVRK